MWRAIKTFYYKINGQYLLQIYYAVGIILNALFIL
jgi:hypothetical protein